MQLSARSMLATGVAMTAAATIAVAPMPSHSLPSHSLPSTYTAPVVLTGAWQDLATNVQADLANLASMIANYPPAPILNQLAANLTTYSHWMAGQDGGTPTLVAQTIAHHAAAVAITAITYGLTAPLSLVGSFIAPGVTVATLISDTAAYPSTPETVLQAFIDAPANYLNTSLNCCSTTVFQLSFGLLNPGPLGYLLSFAPAIANAMKITTPSDSEPSAAAVTTTGEPAAAQPAPRAVAQSRRTPSTASGKPASRSAKRPSAGRTAGDASPAQTSSGKGQSARSARPASPGTR